MRFLRPARHALRPALILSGILLSPPGVAFAQILWSGDFETGNFNQWHKISSTDPNFSQMPAYCRPLGYGAAGGDGTCLELSTSITRQGAYAAKFTVKTAAEGSEPADCDSNGTNCNRRRAELTGQLTQPDVYNSLPYMSERWISISHYVPEDWAPLSDAGWGSITVFSLKPRNESGLSAPISINLASDHWRIWHRTSDVENPVVADIPWQKQMYYTHDYPQRDGSDGGGDLRADFPDQQVSQTALSSINKGGWTDWVMRVKFDARGAADGGTGFLTLWKREDSGPWIKVLDIHPKRITRGGLTFDRGIGYNSPPTATNNGGFGPRAGLYMHKADAWDLPTNRSIYSDNIKIGSALARFADMSPDGSSPGNAAPAPVESDEEHAQSVDGAEQTSSSGAISTSGHGTWDAGTYTLTTNGSTSSQGRVQVDMPTVPGAQYTVHLTYDVNLNASDLRFRTQIWDMSGGGTTYGESINTSAALATGTTTETVEWTHSFVALGELTRIAGQYTGVSGNAGSWMRLVRTKLYGPSADEAPPAETVEESDDGATEDGLTDTSDELPPGLQKNGKPTPPGRSK